MYDTRGKPHESASQTDYFTHMMPYKLELATDLETTRDKLHKTTSNSEI